MYVISSMHSYYYRNVQVLLHYITLHTMNQYQRTLQNDKITQSSTGGGKEMNSTVRFALN